MDGRRWCLSAKMESNPMQQSIRLLYLKDTCSHGCPYCSSTMNPEIALRRYKTYDPVSTALIGSPEPSEKNPSAIERPLI